MEVNGVPIVKNIGKGGFKDPYNHTYNKRFMGGEKYGFGVSLFSSVGGSSFVKPVDGLENFQFPNRREALSSDSKSLSYLGSPTSATVTGSVDETFEVFDLESAIQKSDKCTFKNILEAGSKSRSKVNSAGCPDEGFGSQVSGSQLGYFPYRPVSHNDLDIGGLNYRVNLEVDNGSSDVSYNPKGYAPNYYSTGIAVGGIQNLPSWVKGFSVVRTDPAGRVIAQGVGMYSLIEGDFNTVGNASIISKAQNKLWFHSADLRTLNSDLIEDIKSNPEDYKVQIVSALGFFTEMYSFEQNSTQSSRDRIVDLVSYARILHDEGQINPTEHAGMGVGSGGKRYVAHNKYRNSDAASSGPFGGDGNTLLDISSFSDKSDGRSSYFEIEFSKNIYNHASVGGNSEKDFNDSGLKDWHEPIYMVNIINVGAEVDDNNINNYKSTGHFQKIESVIGVGDSTADQEFELVDERWEDCIPDLSSGGSFAGFNSYIYMVDTFGISKTWMNVVFKTPAEITSITNDIINNGFHSPEPGVEVVGLYRNSNPNNRDFSLIFDVPSFYPTEDDFITIKYDDRRPLSVFGGDTIVAENVFSPIDKRNTDRSLDDPSNLFVFNAGFPFRQFEMNPRHFEVIRTTGTNKIQDATKGSLGYIRQLLLMYAGESRAAINFSHNTAGDPENQYFPLINYVMRPHNLGTTNLYGQFLSDYPGEDSIFAFGGFRFNQAINIDYSYDGPIQYFSKPKFGFDEVTEFCTAVIWSLPRAINVQDSPGLKTFTSINRFDIADDQGEIKKAYDATTGGKGENLYAITEKGICLLLTKKAILSNIDSDDLTTTASDQFISGEYWISKEIGSDSEMWRGMGEGTIGFITDSGSIEKEVLFFPNKQSVFSLVENQNKRYCKTKILQQAKTFLRGVKKWV